MKVCASCGASLPDGAAFCIACGSKEFKSEFMPDLDAPQPEKPKIEYDQYGRPIGQQFAQQQYEQPHFSESYEDQYEQKFSDQVDHPQFLEGYQSSGYSQSQSYDTPQYIEGYQPQYSQQYQQYQQPAYDDSQQYQQRSVYEQSQQYQQQPVYEQSQQYQQQPAYEQPQQYQQQPVYEQPQQYQQQPVYEEPQQYQQPVVPEPEPDPKPVEKEFDPYEAAKENSNKVDPHEAAKNFKFEKKEPSEQQEEIPENPKNLKEYIAYFRNTDDHTNEYDPYKFSEKKSICRLTVLGPTFWLPFVAAKDSASARFYANQGLLVFIVELILLIPEVIFTTIVGIGFSLGAQIIVGLVIDVILTLIIYSVPIFMIASAWKDMNEGKIKDIPFIGKLRIIK